MSQLSGVQCQNCRTKIAIIKCLQCVQSKICQTCDLKVHTLNGSNSGHKRESLMKTDCLFFDQYILKKLHLTNYKFQLLRNQKSNLHFKKFLSDIEKKKPQIDQQLFNKQLPKNDLQKINQFSDSQKQIDSKLKNQQNTMEILNMKEYDQKFSQNEQKITNQERELQELIEKTFQERNGGFNLAIQILRKYQKIMSQLLQQKSQHNKELTQQRNEFQLTINEHEGQLLQKEEEINAVQQIQNAFQIIGTELEQKEEIIKQLQGQLEQESEPAEEEVVQKQAPPQKKGTKGQTNNNNSALKRKEEELQKLNDAIQEKEDQSKKLEGIQDQIQLKKELIENFKQLYEQMNDEKNTVAEENERLAQENDQFRELLQQNLHLFGINQNEIDEQNQEYQEHDQEDQYEDDTDEMNNQEQQQHHSF